MNHHSEQAFSALAEQLTALAAMSAAQLRMEYFRLFGEGTRSHNRVWLGRRIAWRLQALAEGGLSERAQKRARELACDADLRLTAPRMNRRSQEANTGSAAPNPGCTDPPPVPNTGLSIGTLLTRRYKGAVLEVHVTTAGFEYRGTVYRSLSAVAKAITGSHLSGHAFFHLKCPRGGP